MFSSVLVLKNFFFVFCVLGLKKCSCSVLRSKNFFLLCFVLFCVLGSNFFSCSVLFCVLGSKTCTCSVLFYVLVYFFVFELFSYNQSWADTDTKNFEIVDTDNDTDTKFNYGFYRPKVSRGKWTIA